MLGLTRTGTGGVLAAVVAMMLAGCSGADSGVELNGKIFDAVGLTGVGKKSAEPNLAERAPLVPPPRTDALPAPGSATIDAGHMAWPDDPDKRRAALAAADKNSKVNKYCTDPMIGRPDAERAKRDSECSKETGGLLDTATAWFSTKKDGGAAVSTDEGDPGVVTGSTKPAPAAAAAKTSASKAR